MYQLCGLVVQHVLYYNWHFDLYGGGLILQMFYTLLYYMTNVLPRNISLCMLSSKYTCFGLFSSKWIKGGINVL